MRFIKIPPYNANTLNKLLSGEIAKKEGVIYGGCSLALTKEELLDLKKCIDKALSSFDSFQE